MLQQKEQAAVKTILIVEDDESTREFFRLAIPQETPHRAVVVADSAEALNIVREIKPDLLLLDYRLPTMTGIELYDQFHALKELECTPTIITSASDLEDKVGGRNITVLMKPFELDDLLNAIQKLLA